MIDSKCCLVTLTNFFDFKSWDKNWKTTLWFIENKFYDELNGCQSFMDFESRVFGNRNTCLFYNQLEKIAENKIVSFLKSNQLKIEKLFNILFQSFDIDTIKPRKVKIYIPTNDNKKEKRLLSLLYIANKKEMKSIVKSINLNINNSETYIAYKIYVLIPIEYNSYKK